MNRTAAEKLLDEFKDVVIQGTRSDYRNARKSLADIIERACGQDAALEASEKLRKQIYDFWHKDRQGFGQASSQAIIRNWIEKVLPERSCGESVQSEVTAWAKECFGIEQVTDPALRSLRLAEETIEFAQSVDCDAAKLHALIDYVYSRDRGQPAQELGGVGVTALVAAASVGVQFEECLLAEVRRVKSKPISHFSKRNQDKVDAGFGALPSPPTGRTEEK